MAALLALLSSVMWGSADYVAGKLRANDVSQVVIYALGARGLP